MALVRSKNLEWAMLKGQVFVQKNVLRTQRYWEISKTLVVCFLLVEFIGLIWPILPILGAFKLFPRIFLFINIVLGVFVVYRSAAGILALDWLQELLPEGKKDEIESYLQTGRVASVVGVMLFLLLIPSVWDAHKSLGVYFLTITLIIISTFLMGLGAPAKEKGGKKK